MFTFLSFLLFIILKHLEGQPARADFTNQAELASLQARATHPVFRINDFKPPKDAVIFFL